jgi:uncharacterized membrane protein YqaE (UPF0057 family)
MPKNLLQIMRRIISINLVFLIGLFGVWTTKRFGNVDIFYPILLVLTLILINGIMFAIWLENKKKTNY